MVNFNDEKKEDKIIDLNKSIIAREVDNLGELLPKIYSTFAKNLKPNIIACYESIDDTLFDLAEKADSNKQQTTYFESMRSIRQSREKMTTEFFNSIKSIFASFKRHNFDFFQSEESYSKKNKALSLSLVDEKELDETLAKTNLINKSEMAYHKHIFALEKRFSVLASGTTIKPNQIPIGPYVIVNSFAKSIKKVDLPVNLKLIVYKIFERTVMGNLNEIYSQSNSVLANKGIVPEIVYNIGRSNQGNNFVNQPQNQINDQAENINPDNLQQHNNGNIGNNTMAPQYNNTINQQNTDQNYQLISQLFTHNNQNNTPVNQVPNNQGQMVPVSNVDMGSMINALTILQSDLIKKIDLKEQTNKTPTEIKDELIKQLHKLDSDTAEQRVKQQDEDTIDLVGMLFQFLVDDRNLPATIQVVLAKLQIPYLKIALEDRNLFADKTHPARILLDTLSSSSVGWSKSSDKKLQYLSKVEDITFEVLQIDEYSHEKFEKLTRHFNRFLEKQKKVTDVAQKRTKEKSLGQDKINQAKENSAKLLVEKMTNKQMPILVRDILLGEWSSVLNLIFLRHSSKSEEYLEKVGFIDTIIEYSQGITENKVEITDIVKLSELYLKGLNLVAFNSKELVEKQQELINCISSIHKLDDQVKPVEVIPPEEILKLSEIKKQEHEIVNYIEDIIDPKEDEVDVSQIKDRYIQVVKKLNKGTWMEFIREDKTSIRAKLSWISPITGKFLFVNSRGLKVTDKTTEILAAGLQDKSIKILKQVAIFDRALSAIATKLKKEK